MRGPACGPSKKSFKVKWATETNGLVWEVVRCHFSKGLSPRQVSCKDAAASIRRMDQAPAKVLWSVESPIL